MSEKKFKYLDVYHKIKQDLITGKYPPGSVLPTENELVEIYDASKTTIRHATGILASEKYIEAKQGRGTVVLNFSNYSARKKYKNYTMVETKIKTDGPGVTTNVGGYIEIIQADNYLAKMLDISEGDKVYRIECLHLIDGRAFGYNISYFRGELFPDLEELKFRPASDFYTYLSDTYQFKIQQLQDKYGVAVLEGRHAVQLGLEPGSPVMAIKRRGICDAGVFMYGETYVRTDLYEMTITQNEEQLDNMI